MGDSSDSSKMQTWNAEDYGSNARFVATLGEPVIELLKPMPGERILDLGCGDGALTQKIVQSGAEVIGVDSSKELLAAASQLGLDVRLIDGQHLDYRSEFDAVFSNAALHWMLDSEAVIHGVKKALKPGGRFVSEFGGHGNVAAISTALIATLKSRGIDGAARFPWFFPTVHNYTKQLQSAGFKVVFMQLIPRPTPLTAGMKAWLKTFAAPFLFDLSESDRALVIDDVTSLLSTSLRDEAGQWTADYVRLRLMATNAEN